MEELVASPAADAGRPTRPVKKLSLLCAALPRTALDAVGGLDEGFGRGMFEDDDLCMALSRLGLETVLVESVLRSPQRGQLVSQAAPPRVLRPVRGEPISLREEVARPLGGVGGASRARTNIPLP